MNNAVPYLQNNESFNPLFAKMKERFCSEGTIAERMAIEAGLCKKRSKRVSSSEYHMTHGNSLPKRASVKKSFGFKKAFFSLKSLGAVSMSILIMGVLFLSGASFEGVQKNMLTSEVAQSVDTHMLSETELGTLYFAAEALPETL
ncbi:MAG: hypothetical protein E7609_00470 [Ruminococcaceae bacterium]|nr:hypothetical protein [Oscillospiraceae bacterium]